MIQIQENSDYLLLAPPNLKISNFEPSFLDLDGSADEQNSYFCRFHPNLSASPSGVFNLKSRVNNDVIVKHCNDVIVKQYNDV